MRTLLIVMLLFIAGCTSSTGSGGSDSQSVIEYFSSTCYGTCPSYRVHIHSNGDVIFEPIRFTAVKERMTRHIHPDTVQALLDKAERIRFFDHADSYTHDTLPSGEVVTHSDGQGITLGITEGGKSKSIYMYMGEPQELIDLREHVIGVAIPSSWIRD